jgi:hypothetical protein
MVDFSIFVDVKFNTLRTKKFEFVVNLYVREIYLNKGETR